MKPKLSVLLLLITVLRFSAFANVGVSIFYNENSSRVEFAISEIQNAIQDKGYQLNKLPLSAMSDGNENEFRIIKD